MNLFILLILFVLIFIYFFNLISEDLKISSTLKQTKNNFDWENFVLLKKAIIFLKSNLKFFKNSFKENQQIQKIINNKYLKKVVYDLYKILNSSLVKTYIKTWGKTFSFNIHATKKEFIEFLLMDVIINASLVTILILFWDALFYLYLNEKVVYFLYIFNIAAFFPRFSILKRRLRVRNLSPNLSFLIFFPLVGWVSTWIMGGRDKIIIKKRSFKKSEPKSLLYILTTILVIIILVFLIIFIVQFINNYPF